uniref:Uncharacterized protein n=1 Tax=Aegilops tauschii subsp. strangulata TaxID=200361 RepID=A0A453HMK3_AEGTS
MRCLKHETIVSSEASYLVRLIPSQNLVASKFLIQFCVLSSVSYDYRCSFGCGPINSSKPNITRQKSSCILTHSRQRVILEIT